MNLNITTTLSGEQLKTIINDWFVRKENMAVESITFNRSQLDRVSHTTVIVSLKKHHPLDSYQR